MTTTPSISVALCTYNAGPYLAPQIQSIFAQSLLPAELHISDDGSTDDTLQTLRSLQTQAPFPIHIHTTPGRLGPAKNFESCLQKCTGGILVLCDQDDLWRPDKLQLLSSSLTHSKAILAFSDLSIINADGTPTGLTQWQQLSFTPAQQASFATGHALDVLLKYNVVTGAGAAFKRELLTHALPFPADYLHDEWFALIAACTGRLAPIAQPLVQYRRHAGQQVGPPAAGLLAQARYAKQKMQTPYFEAMVRRADALCHRLSQIPSDALRPGALTLAQQKQSHALKRLAIRQSPLLRSPKAIGELFAGNYARFGYGVKSFAQDLFL